MQIVIWGADEDIVVANIPLLNLPIDPDSMAEVDAAVEAANAAAAAAIEAANETSEAAGALTSLVPVTSDLLYMQDQLVQHTVSSAGQTANFSALAPTGAGGFRVGVLSTVSQPLYVNGGVVTKFKIRVQGACTVACSTWTQSGNVFTRYAIQYFVCAAAGYYEFPCQIAIPLNGMLGYGVPPNMLGANSTLTVLRWFATSTDVASFTDTTSENSQGMVGFEVDAPTGILDASGALTAAENAQASIDVRSPDVDYLSSQLITHADRVVGQTADMSALPATPGSGSKTMVLITSTSYRYPNGGIINGFKVYLTTAGRYSVSSWKEDVPGTIVPLTPHEVKYFQGTVGWNEIDPNIVIPPGGSVGFGVTTTGTVGRNNTLEVLALRATSATENAPFTSSQFNFDYMVSFTTTDPTALNIPGGGDLVPASLIDKTFTDDSGWTLGGATIVSGALESGANAVWTARSRPTTYPYSQLSRRTVSVFGEIVSANQVWGLGFIRSTDGFDLLTPATMVDGTDSTFKVYRYDSQSSSPPAAAAFTSVAIPWTVAGSKVRLDVKRVRFVTTFKLTNLVTGQSVTLTADYAAGTGGDCRAWGVPAILMPSTTSGGVRISRLLSNADYPFPAGSAARVLCVGDSNTEASQIGPNYDDGWAYLLEEERTTRGAQDTVVAARGGQTSGGLATMIDEAVRLCDAKTVALVLIGTNDAVIGASTHAGWRTNMETILTALRTRTQRIALCALPPIGGAGAQAKRTAINADIIGGYFPGLLPPVRFDLALSLANDGVTWNPAYELDANHMNVAGHALMLERVRLDCPEALA